jgi:4-hydroxy-3-polyprenylbenzoate decarboxylase
MKTVIVAITGASGAVYGIRLLEELHRSGANVHLVISSWGRITISNETGLEPAELERFCARVYGENELDAAIASGSFLHDGMIICPCSMKTLSAIRHGFSYSLITRAADITLKERRKLILVVRETPLSDIHLQNMLGLSQTGAVILPPVPAFYHHPRTVADIIDHTVSRILDVFGIENNIIKRWE